MDTEKEGLNNSNKGMLLSRLSIETLYDIADIYGQIVGGNPEALRTYDPMSVLEELNYLKETNFIGWRFGSKLPDDKTQDGKLGIWTQGLDDDPIIRFDFDPNVVQGEEAEKLREEFKQAVAEYLTSQKLAVELPR